jgi:hypothetical protein
MHEVAVPSVFAAGLLILPATRLTWEKEYGHQTTPTQAVIKRNIQTTNSQVHKRIGQEETELKVCLRAQS